MSSSADLIFNIIGKNDSAVKALGEVETKADGTTKKISSGFKKLAGVAAGMVAAGGLKDFLAGSMDEARESQKVNAQTAAVLKSTGKAAGVTADQVGALATQVSNYAGIDDEAIQSGENMLLTFKNIRNEAGKGNDIFNQATKIMADLSVATGTDMKSSAIQLGKALNDPTRGLSALSRVGITFDAQQQKQIKTLQASGDVLGAQKILLKELTSEFGGSAAAQATAADKMSVSWGNFKEAVGTELIPIIDKFENVLTDDVIPAVSTLLPMIGDVAGDVADVLGPAIRDLTGFLADNATEVEIVGSVVGGMWLAWKGYKAAKAAITAVQDGLVALRRGAYQAGSAITSAGSKVRSASTGMKIGMLGVTAVLAAGVYVWQHHKQEVEQNKAAIQAYTDALEQDNGAIGENTRTLAEHNLVQNNSYQQALKMGISQKTLTDAVLGNADALKQVQAAMQAYNDGSNDHKAAIVMLGGAIGTNIKDLAKAKINADDLAAANKGVAQKTDETTASQNKLNGQLEDTNKTVDKQVDATTALSDALDKLSGNAISAERASLDFKDKLASLTQQVKDNAKAYSDGGRSLSQNTEEGRKNLNWVLDAITTANQHAEAVHKSTGSIEKATSALGKDETALRNAAKAAGFNKSQVDALIKKYAAVPSKVKTTVDANVAPAEDALARLGQKLLDATRFSAPDGHKYAYIPGRGVRQVAAQGTGYAQPGLTLVGEYGAELLRTRRGDQILTHTQTESMLRGSTGGAPVIVQVDVHGSVLAQNDLVGVLESAVARGVKLNISRGVV